MNEYQKHLKKLRETIQILRGPTGCPWDKKQSPQSLVKYIKEEVDELVTAIQNDDPENICEELGDVVYVLLMLAEIYEHNDIFTLSTSLRLVDEKLIRRHPHVFDSKGMKVEEIDLRKQWESIKAKEKNDKI